MAIIDRYHRDRRWPSMMVLFAVGFFYSLAAAIPTYGNSLLESSVSSNSLQHRNEKNNPHGLHDASQSGSTLEGTFTNRIAQATNDVEDVDCSLCQGLSILADKIPSPVDSPTLTCADLSAYYQSEDYALGKEFLGGDPSTGIKVNSQETCRSDLGFNFFFDLCCKASVPQYQCETNIQEFLFGGDYNKAVPPITDLENPLTISVFLQYETLEHIDVEDGTATIFVTLILTWTDPRLQWEVSDFDLCNNAIDVFTGHELEKTMIWLPDFDVLNKIEGVQSMPDFKATVYSDGTVQWVLSGGLTAFCAFTGLAELPFDTLGCQILFGGQSREFNQKIKYVIEIPDLFPYGLFDVSYNEWKPVPELTKHGLAFSNSVIYYDFFFQRAKNYYMNNILIPTIILTYLSFFTFLLDMRVGERLGFGMALALVVVAQQIVTAGLIPISDQRLWLDKYVGWSFYWVLFGVVQSTLIGFLYYLREDHQAKKENKDLERMGRESRRVMMENARGELEEGTEELMGLNDNDDVVVHSNDDVVVHSLSTRRESCFYTFSIRKFDLYSLAFAVITYTTFVVTMFVTSHTGIWLTEDPRWFNEEDATYVPRYYDVHHPNS